MQDVSLTTSEQDIDVTYGMYDLRPERESARTSLKYILTDVNDIKKRYFSLGFHLHEFKGLGYYQDFGYQDIYEFCERNLGMSKTAVSNCINVFERFCVCEMGVCKNQIQDRYAKYSYSQLCEMLPLKDADLVAFQPEQTVTVMREMKKNMKENARAEKTVVENVVPTSEQPTVRIESFNSQEFVNELFEELEIFIEQIAEMYKLKLENLEVSGKSMSFSSHDAKYRLMLAVYEKK